jgi:MFS family permease
MQKFLEDLGVNRTVVALSMARLGDAIGNSIIFIVIPLYVAQLPSPLFQLPETVRVGILISSFGLMSAILQPFMGAISDRLGKRKLLIMLGLLVMGLGTLAFIYANNFSELLILRSLQGIGVALTIPAALAIMATATHQTTRGGSMGIYTTMRMVGFATGPLLGGFLYDRYGFTMAYVAGAAFIFLGLFLVQIWVKEDHSQAAKEKLAAQRAKPFKVFDAGLITGGILGVALATFLMAGDFSMISTLETQFNSRLNMTAFGFGVGFSAMIIGRLVFQLPLGKASDKIGRKPFIISGLVFMAPITGMLGFVMTSLQFVILRLLQGVGSAAIAAPAFALAGDLAKEGGEGRQMAVVTTGFGLGTAIGPLMAGIFAAYSFWLPFVIAAAVTLVGAWVVQRTTPETVERELPAVKDLLKLEH